MPTKNRVWCDDAVQFSEYSATERLTGHSEPPTRRVRKSDPPFPPISIAAPDFRP